MVRTGCLDASSRILDFVDALRSEATTRHGVPESLAEQAARITLGRFERELRASLGRTDQRRLRAYFYAVVRRRAVASRSPELRELRSRLLLSTLAADLKDTGRSGREIFLEIAQDYAGHVDPSALQALEASLCG